MNHLRSSSDVALIQGIPAVLSIAIFSSLLFFNTASAQTIPLSDAITQLTPGNSEGIPVAIGSYNHGITNEATTPPAGWTAGTAWAVVYQNSALPVSSAGIANVVQVQGFKMYLHLTNGTWVKVQDQATDGIGGAHYLNDFSTDQNFSFNPTTQADGSVTFDAPYSNYNDHFWPGNRATFGAGTVDGIFVQMQIKVNDPSFNLLAEVGGDWWLSNAAGYGGYNVNNTEIGYGNWIKLTTSYRNVYYSTLSASQLQSNPPPGFSTAAPQPTATLAANQTSITSGSATTLTWSSTNATSCTGSGFAASGTSGSVSVSPTANTTYSITCAGAGGTSPVASASVTVVGTGTDLALKKIATASSVQTDSTGTYSANFAFDGDSTTRWGSALGVDPGWVYVDLGGIYAINEVVLNWEAAYATAYQIQVSNDATNWTTIYSTTTGTGGVQDLKGLNGTGRYVRMYGTARGTQWGYSLWEMGVYGSAVVLDTQAPSIPTGLSATAVSSSQINLSWSASTDNVGVTGYNIFRNGTKIGTSATNSYSDSGLAASTVYRYAVSAYDAAGNTSAQSASVSMITSSVSSSIAVGSSIVTTAKLNVRQSPLSGATKVGSVPSGTFGTVIGGPTIASGYTWWQVNYATGISGWSIGNYLVPASPTTTSSPTFGSALPNPSQKATLFAQIQAQLQDVLKQLRIVAQEAAAAAAFNN